MSREIRLLSYDKVSANWPSSGNHIIASFTETTVLVYQAFNDEIGNYALEYQKFEGCPEYNLARMTWIKTSFLWMMKRSHYATRKNQTRILGIWLFKEAFDDILRKARFKGPGSGKTRIQWDPSYTPELQPIKWRRDIQLGIKQRRSFYTGDDIKEIVDCTELAHLSHNTRAIPDERVYVPDDDKISEIIKLGTTC